MSLQDSLHSSLFFNHYSVSRTCITSRCIEFIRTFSIFLVYSCVEMSEMFKSFSRKIFLYLNSDIHNNTKTEGCLVQKMFVFLKLLWVPSFTISARKMLKIRRKKNYCYIGTYRMVVANELKILYTKFCINCTFVLSFSFLAF